MLVALEIDDANLLLVTAANAASCHATVTIASAGLLANLDQASSRACVFVISSNDAMVM